MLVLCKVDSSVREEMLMKMKMIMLMIVGSEVNDDVEC